VSRFLILTPDPASPVASGRWREVFDRMVAPLASEGVEVEGRPWTEVGDLSGFDLVAPLVTWGYHADFERFTAMIATLEASGVAVANPPSVLRWNADKAYLNRLWSQGAPAIPTLFLERADPASVAEAAARLGAERLVVKPRVSAGSYRTLRVRPGDPLDGAPDGPALVQPYLPSVETEGESSLIFCEKVFSHAIRKVAAPGEFRVQPEYGGRITPLDPPKDVMDAARAILDAVEEPLLYARVDMVRDLDGAPALIELELLEPDLYLDHDPGAGAAFAKAVRRRIEANPI
jgi:glutathione synthase/RimK-type ligase-like ATP-grasp enzyme